MALTELAIKNAKARTKIVKLSDGGGLQLWITPDGAKRWRKAYRFNGAQRTLAIGVYPTFSEIPEMWDKSAIPPPPRRFGPGVPPAAFGVNRPRRPVIRSCACTLP